MSASRHQLAGGVLTTLQETFDQIRLARATELARSGRLLEAVALLTPGGELPASTSSLDLLARIAVKLKDFRTAERCWQSALQLEPENPAYPKCLHELEVAKNKAVVRQKWVASLSAASVGAALVVLGFLLWRELVQTGIPWRTRHPAPLSSLQPKPTPPKNNPAPAPSKPDAITPRQ